jgi:hypothetical protein
VEPVKQKEQKQAHRGNALVQLVVITGLFAAVGYSAVLYRDQFQSVIATMLDEPRIVWSLSGVCIAALGVYLWRLQH